MVKQYIRERWLGLPENRVARSFFSVGKNDAAEMFTEEASRHPVFRITS